MNCPKCNFEQVEGKSECGRCGIIFEKYYSWIDSYSENTECGTINSTLEETNPSITISQIFFYTKQEGHLFFFWGRLIVLTVTIIYGIKFMSSPIESNYAGDSFLHLVNLPFHEAGHVFFRPFGSFMASLGGTLGQFLMPLICFTVLLIKTRDTFGASVTLWWFGQNFFDIAPYVNDARSLNLPLVGGNVGHSSPYGFHDWEYLLTESGLLRYDHFLADLCIIIGTIVFLVSYAWGAILLFRQYYNRSRS